MNISLNNYKFSKFNHKTYIDNNLYFYNSLTGAFGKLNDEDKHFFNNCNLSTHTIPIGLSNDTIKALLQGGYIVHKEIDENQMIESIHNINRYGNTKSLGLTIIPTTSCNFRCTYCFEQENDCVSEIMSLQIIEGTLNFIDRNLDDNTDLSISWFGGEPLIGLDVIEDIYSGLHQILSKKNIRIFSGIVTNGYLLSKDVSDKLVELGITTAQITLDGDANIHDKRRMLKNGDGTYEKILDNILNANSDLRISIRMNVDKSNIQSADIFLESLKAKGIFENENVSINFAITRDYDSSKKYLSEECFSMSEFAKEEAALNKLAISKGIRSGDIAKLNPNLANCGALSPRTFVIEPSGIIQKCWSSVGNNDHAIGHLISEEFQKKEHHYLSNQYKWYSWQGYNKEDCKNCNVLPLCMGGCPYFDIHSNQLFKNNNYSCTPLKYNLNKTLEYLALNR